ncbi:hypothetical protein Peur_034661 [Populus x canadensis]
MLPEAVAIYCHATKRFFEVTSRTIDFTNGLQDVRAVYKLNKKDRKREVAGATIIYQKKPSGKDTAGDVWGSRGETKTKLSAFGSVLFGIGKIFHTNSKIE